MRRIMMFSGGEMSWAAAKRDASCRGLDGLELLFADTKVEDEDTYRFLHQAAANIGAPLHVVADGRDIWELFRDRKMIGNTRVDLCSAELKRGVCDDWLKNNCDPKNTIVLLGYHIEEVDRFYRSRDRYAAKGWRCEAPMCDKPWFTPHEITAMREAAGLPLQKLYRLGFPHANCGGFCVKAGHAHFRHLLKTLPEVYRRHEEEEEETRRHIGRDVSVLRDRRGGKTVPLTMRSFRERVEGDGQIDLFDWGGCDCFGETLQ